MARVGFEDKLLSKLGKLNPDDVQNYLAPLLAQKQFLQTTFDHLDEGVVVTDADLTILFANRKATRMLGLPQGRNLVGEDLGERVSRQDALGEALNSLRANRRAIEAYEYPFGPNQERVLSLSTLPMRAQLGDRWEEELLIILLRDVTDRHRRQSEQARARRLASLAILTSGIAHEIKNPLNSLNIHAQLLKEEVEQAKRDQRPPDAHKTERACDVILEETVRLRRIVEDFIQAARPRTPRLEARPLAPLFEIVDRIFRPECEKLDIEFVVRVETDLPPLLIDEHLLLQALRNLVRNAIEAHKEQRREAAREDQAPLARIEVHAALGTDSVDIAVADNGPGIPEGTIEHIFEPHFTTRFGGSGLGLMVVDRIVTEHRGSIHVDTKPGEGVRFVISLPLHQRPIRLLENQQAAGSTEPDPTQTRTDGTAEAS